MEQAKINVEIFDTTLRDGAQSLPLHNQFPRGSKPDIANVIAELGVSVIEAGFPSTPGDFDQVLGVARTVGNTKYQRQQWLAGEQVGIVSDYPQIAGLSRTKPDDIEKTWCAIKDAKKPRIHTFISTDPDHMAAKFKGKTPDEVFEMGRKAIVEAKNLTSSNPDASVEFSAEAASTTDMGFLQDVVSMAVSEGVDVINVPDTVGQRDPFWMNRFYREVINWALMENPDVTISAHNHNDTGQAVANTLALMRSAQQHARASGNDINIQFESTVCGLGERAGNADVFPVVAGLFKFNGEYEEVPVSWQFNSAKSVSVANFVMGQTKRRWWNRPLGVDRQNPVVGSDILTHRSGIHSDGVIKGGHEIYTALTPVFWGHRVNAIHEEGDYQGRAGRTAARQA